MITHVVLFTLEDAAEIEATASLLRDMAGRIDALDGIEVGVDVAPSDRSAHIALITRHASRAALEAYRVHPVHQQVLQHMRQVTDRSVKVDFES